jgi:hypothetical protein
MHADSDVLAATAHSSVYSSDPDAPDIEIGHRPTHLVPLIALGFAMTLLSASLAFEMWGELGGSTTAGSAGVILFGLATCRLIWMLPAERGAVVVVTRYGIRDLRIGNEFLLWDSIQTVSARESRGYAAVVLTLIPALRQQRTCLGARRGARNDEVVIGLDGLATDAETLLRVCRAFHAAGEHGTASQQRRDCKAQSFAVPAS